MSTDSLPSYKTVQSLFERLALAAAKEIMAVCETGFDVCQKADTSPVTEADMRAEAVIIEGLQRELAGIPFVGEEEVSSGKVPGDLGDCFILIDPLDGTREFVGGRDEYTVNIALVRSGKPDVGVVLAPAMGVAYSARPGNAERYLVGKDGPTSERERISVVEPGRNLRIVASCSHRTAETAAFIGRYPDAEVLSVGSSLKFCLLAEGKADLYPRFGRTMEWDTAAGDAVLRAAGGRTRLVDGGELEYGKRNLADDCDFANPWFISETT